MNTKPSIIKNSAPLKSKVQLKYEKLLNEIKDQQAFIKNLKESLRKAESKIKTDITPLEKKHNIIHRDLVIQLDKLATDIGLGKYNREWFETYMADETDYLLDIFGYQDEQLSAIFKKYTGTSLTDILENEETKEMAQRFSNIFGFEVDIKEMLDKGQHAYFAEYQQKILEQLLEKEQAKYTDDDFATKPKQKGKSIEEDKLMAKDARNIYMRLIKKFHPDLEPDETERHRKTEIVKEVTKAYHENDFFNLLKLQITYLEEGETDTTDTAEDMLKRYNKILQKQLNELRQYIQEQHMASSTIIEDFIDKNGNLSAPKFAARRKNLENEIKMLQRDLQDALKRPKTFFKEYIRHIKDQQQQSMIQNMFANMFSDMKF